MYCLTPLRKALIVAVVMVATVSGSTGISLMHLPPASCLPPAAPVSFRPPPLGPRGPPGQSWSQGELLCPPGTFVRIVDGRADSAGLYYLALTCSDGTFLGGQGSAGMDGTPFVISTVSDGFTSLTGGNPGGSVVSVSLTRTDGTQSQTYGMLTEDAAIATTSCRENERIVGLCFRTYSDDMLPGLGPIGLMCDDCPGKGNKSWGDVGAIAIRGVHVVMSFQDAHKWITGSCLVVAEAHAYR